MGSNLEEYQYTIEHRAGTRMRHVGALSRYPSFQVLVVSEELDTVWERIKRCQEMDKELTRLKVKVQ